MMNLKRKQNIQFIINALNLDRAESNDIPKPDLENSLWSQFSKNTTGEWRGVMCTFDVIGNIIPVPDRYTPSAFKEWGMQLYDWQTQTSVRVSSKDLTSKFRQLYTGAGCECNQLADSKEHRALLKESIDDWTVKEDGSYISAPMSFSSLPLINSRIEICLRYDLQFRKRFVVNLNSINVKNIELHKEVYQSDFVGGLDIEDFDRGIDNISDLPKAELSKITYISNQPQYKEFKEYLKAENILLLPEDNWICVDGKDIENFVIIAGCFYSEEKVSMAMAKYKDKKLNYVKFF